MTVRCPPRGSMAVATPASADDLLTLASFWASGALTWAGARRSAHLPFQVFLHRAHCWAPKLLPWPGQEGTTDAHAAKGRRGLACKRAHQHMTAAAAPRDCRRLLGFRLGVPVQVCWNWSSVGQGLQGSRTRGSGLPGCSPLVPVRRKLEPCSWDPGLDGRSYGRKMEPGQARQWSRQRVGTMMDEVGRPRRPKDKGQSGGQSERGKVRTGLLPPQAFFPPSCLPSSARQLDFYFWQVAPRGSRSINIIHRLHRVNNHDAPRGHFGVPARLHIPGLIFSPLRLLSQDRPPPPQT